MESLMASKLLTKSRYMNGLQCPRLLWIVFNEPEKLPETDAATQYNFDQGHEVNDWAHRLYPEGVNLPADDFKGNLLATRTALSQRKTIFEAGILANDLYCRADILAPAGAEEWDIIEVKSSTSVKDEHLDDVSFQRHVCRQAGLAIRRCHVMYLNKEYIKQGDVVPSSLFITEDVTDRLDPFAQGLEERIEGMRQCIRSLKCPDAIIGGHCGSPYPCGLQPDCWDSLPEHNVMTLTYGKKLGEELLARGILDIREIPDSVALNEKQAIQKDCAAGGEPHIQVAGLRGFLKKLKYPLYFMDFETFKTAIPFYDGTRPHQNLPFQFSADRVERRGDEPRHYSFLAEGRDDPRPAFMAALAGAVGSPGTILVYNQTFEKTILTETARFLPQYQSWVDDAISRIVDLLAPFKGFLYYHPSQHGSASLKKVLPALTGITYDNLDIADGELASLSYMKAAFDDIPEEERRLIRANLETYCGQDSGGMIAMIRKLEELAG
jgi:hypothetical protein